MIIVSSEMTPADSSLMDVAIKGVDRPPFAADCLNVLLKELVGQANEGKCKLAVMADGINAIFCPNTLIHKEQLSKFGRKRYTTSFNTGLLAPEDMNVFCSLKKNIR
jgi:hypothetical protein